MMQALLLFAIRCLQISQMPFKSIDLRFLLFQQIGFASDLCTQKRNGMRVRC